jgi:hypothetical protein
MKTELPPLKDFYETDHRHITKKEDEEYKRL